MIRPNVEPGFFCIMEQSKIDKAFALTQCANDVEYHIAWLTDENRSFSPYMLSGYRKLNDMMQHETNKMIDKAAHFAILELMDIAEQIDQL